SFFVDIFERVSEFLWSHHVSPRSPWNDLLRFERRLASATAAAARLAAGGPIVDPVRGGDTWMKDVGRIPKSREGGSHQFPRNAGIKSSSTMTRAASGVKSLPTRSRRVAASNSK